MQLTIRHRTSDHYREAGPLLALINTAGLRFPIFAIGSVVLFILAIRAAMVVFGGPPT